MCIDVEKWKERKDMGKKGNGILLKARLVSSFVRMYVCIMHQDS
jgi:hypothetical protein